MRLKYLRVLIAAAVVVVIVTSVASQTKTQNNVSAKFGNQTILIPTPDGLQEGNAGFETITAIFKASEPPQNDLLAQFVAESDIQQLRLGKPPLMDYYAKVSTLHAFREQYISPTLFAAIVEEFRKNTEPYLDPDRPATKQVIESVEKQIAKNSGTTANLEIGKPKNLGDFNNSANVYSILILSSVKLEAGDQGLDRMILAGASLVHVKSRILFVNCYRTYKSDADVETIKESVNKWVKSIITANEAN